MRSSSSSRSKSSFCTRTELYSPAAMEIDPATSPARPATRTTAGAGSAPATPRIRPRLETRPSLTPKTAARAAPPVTSRWWPSSGEAWVRAIPRRYRRLRSEWPDRRARRGRVVPGGFAIEEPGSALCRSRLPLLPLAPMTSRYDARPADVAEVLAGEPAYRARQVWDGLHRRGLDPEEMSD